MDRKNDGSRTTFANLVSCRARLRLSWQKGAYSLGGKIAVVNLTNKDALYNLLSFLPNALRFSAYRPGPAEVPFSSYFAGGGVAGGGPGGGGSTNFASSTGTFCFSSST
jgi:hypothetical protein